MVLHFDPVPTLFAKRAYMYTTMAGQIYVYTQRSICQAVSLIKILVPGTVCFFKRDNRLGSKGIRYV
jgi:hypothetical protein